MTSQDSAQSEGMLLLLPPPPPPRRADADEHLRNNVSDQVRIVHRQQQTASAAHAAGKVGTAGAGVEVATGAIVVAGIL